MATTNIKIKYFADYPVYTFYEDFELPEAKIVDYKYQVPATSEAFGHVADSNRTQRNIQIKYNAVYQVELITGKNLDWYKLQNANHVVVTPVDEEPFIATNIIVKYSQVENNMDSYCTIQFEKQLYIKDELSSDFVYLMKTGANSNSIEFDVKNPPFVFNNVNIYADDIIPSDYNAYFQIPLNGLTEGLALNDFFYLHTDNTDFNSELDNSGYHLAYAFVYAIGSDTITLRCNFDNIDSSLDYDIVNLTIDHITDGRDLPTGVVINDKTLSFNIYTFIDPIYRHETELIEGLELENGRKENQVTIEKDIAYFKIWLKYSEKWKAEYLNYALNSDILINLYKYDNIIPSQTKDIITMADNPRLIDLFEYDIKAIYNIKKVNINR